MDERRGEGNNLEIHQRYEEVRVCYFSVDSGGLNRKDGRCAFDGFDGESNRIV